MHTAPFRVMGLGVALLLAALSAPAATVTAIYNAATDVPVTASGYTATGDDLSLTLNHAPPVGTELMVVKNTGLDFISGTFSNLTQGQIVPLTYSGTTYYFAANYYGGSGNDLVLTWAHTRAFAWGLNTGGQLGDGSTTQRNLPGAVAATGVLAGKTVVSLANGQTHSLALCSDGTLAAWGQNTHGQLGDGTTTPHIAPAAVTTAGTPLAGKTIVAIAAGTSHSLALCSDGTVASWGYNNSGQLGDGTLLNRSLPVAVTVAGSGLSGRSVVGIAAGYLFSLALCSDGRVAAWGYNANGQLGDTTGGASPIPVLAAQNGPLFGRSVIAVSACVNHTLALCSDSLITSWGFNFAGQLGDNSTSTRYSAVSVVSTGTPLAGKVMAAVATGEHHSLALAADGTLAGWGQNTYGQVGDNTVAQRNIPVAVITAGTPLSGRTVVAIGGGTSHSLALCSDGTLAAWGKNTSGQLGDNSTTQRNVPVAVDTSTLTAGARFTRIFDGSYADHTLALVASPAAPPPAAETMAATSVTDTTATLHGTIYAYGSSTTVSFDYGTTSAYGTNVAGAPTTITGDTLTAVSTTLTGLIPNTTYHYRVNGSSSGGTTAGSDLTFATISSDANLSNLALSAGSLSPVFSSNTTNYSASVNTAHLTVTPTTVDANATVQVRVNGGSFAAVASGSPGGSLTMGVGLNTVEIRVTSSDAATVRTYTVTITRATPVPITYTYNASGDVPVTSANYEATDNTVALTLNFSPTPGTELMVVKNTGLDFIDGVFSNLAQGQAVALSFSGTTYNFVANYYGGTGNDLVLVWAATRAFAWGENVSGQLGDNTTARRLVPTRSRGALAGRTILSLAAGTNHSLALCSDGSLVTWGRNVEGQVGDGSGLQRNSPMVLPTAGTPLAGKTVVAIAAGSSHNLVLCSDGTLAAWGYNDFGQVGDNSTSKRTVPVAVVIAGTPLEGKTVVAIAAGVYHSMALCSDGTVATWGWNQQGQLGDNTNTQRTKPVALITTGTPLAGKTVTAIAAGWAHSLALCSDGTLAAWGMVGFGVYSNLPVGFDGTGALAGKTAAAIAAGYNHSLILCSDGTVAGWGVSYSGQLGTGGTGSSDVPVAVSTAGVLAGKTVVEIAAGFEHSLARCTDGTMVAWGSNFNGQLGDNSTTQQNTPVLINTSSLAAGEVCARLFSGPYALHTMGVMSGPPVPEIAVFADAGVSPDTEQQHSTSSFGFPLTPVSSSNPQTFTIQNIGTADLDSLAVTSALSGNPGDFAVNVAGLATTLAPGGTTGFTVTFAPSATGTRNAAVQVASNAAAKNPFVLNLVGNETLTAAFTTATDAAVTAGSYTATGRLVNLSLGFAPVPGTDLMVVRNTGLGFITGTFGNLAPGQTVALTYGGITYDFVANYHGGSGNDLVLVWATGRLLAWGNNAAGQLGDNTTAPKNSPVPVTATGVLAGKTVVAQAIGQTHSLALCADGTLVAWGQNDVGQLGDGTTTQRNLPGLVTTAGTPLAGKTVVAITAGTAHSLALCSDGTLVAWGYNGSGQLGDGTTTSRLLPVAVSTAGVLSGKTVVKIAAGYLYSLALCSDGTVASWGYNINGQLGNSTGANSAVPVAVTTSGVLSGKTVVSLSACVNHTLALCSDGTLVSWGFNFAGELGDNTTTSRTAPVAVTVAGTALAGKTVVATAAGEHHSLALCSDGTLVAWGQNTSGQLGEGTGSDRYTAVSVLTVGTALAGKTVTAIAAGTSHSLALCADGTLAEWGKNLSGQLGDGTNTLRIVAVAVNSSSLAVGERFIRATGGSYADHTVALVASGTPEMAVFDGTGTGGTERQSNTGSFPFAGTAVGASSSAQNFTIQNIGTTTLTGLGVAMSGTHPGDYSAGSLGAASLAPGATTTFTVTFSPTAAGTRSAVVQISSNDADESPFDLIVTGNGLSALASWRQTHFGSPDNTGNGADGADPDLDGLANLVEYALGLDPTAASTVDLPVVSTTATDWVYTYTRPAATTEVTYDVEISTNLVNWTIVPTVHEIVSASGGIETWHALYPLNAAGTVFFRLKVTVP